MRPLSAEEQALWARVTASIRPLSRDKPGVESVAAVSALAPSAPPATATPKSAPPPRRPPPPPPRRHAIANTLDGGWDRRLKSGSVDPDRILDLHGHNLDQAWEAIDRSLETAINRGERVLLLITGHARKGDPPVERGRIRAAVNDWLTISRHSSRIAAVRQAHRRHGGGGSLYLILRR
ncbi:MAG: Smr/MutS family protein [Sphingomonas bacterium]|nr:Smr/MutS family protein [Sphingomonas bacterium]